MTNEERKVIELALAALKELVAQNENRYWAIKHDHFAMKDARYAIARAREALAQPDQDEVDIRSRLYQRIHELETQLAQPEQTNTRPYYTIDELNAWADEKEKQAWRNAAIRIGEELSSVGPDDYYDMDAWKWLDWAMEQEPRGKNSLAQPEQSNTCGEPDWKGLVLSHNEDCESRCDMDRCGYKPYYEYSKRRCPDCPVHEKIWVDDTTPPQRKPLSDEQIAEMWLEILGSTPPSGIHEDGLQPWRFTRAIEAAHGIKE